MTTLLAAILWGAAASAGAGYCYCYCDLSKLQEDCGDDFCMRFCGDAAPQGGPETRPTGEADRARQRAEALKATRDLQLKKMRDARREREEAESRRAAEIERAKLETRLKGHSAPAPLTLKGGNTPFFGGSKGVDAAAAGLKPGAAPPRSSLPQASQRLTCAGAISNRAFAKLASTAPDYAQLAELAGQAVDAFHGKTTPQACGDAKPLRFRTEDELTRLGPRYERLLGLAAEKARLLVKSDRDLHEAMRRAEERRESFETVRLALESRPPSADEAALRRAEEEVQSALDAVTRLEKEHQEALATLERTKAEHDAFLASASAQENAP